MVVGIREAPDGQCTLSPHLFGGFNRSLLTALLSISGDDGAMRTKVWTFWLDCHRAFASDVEVTAQIDPVEPTIEADPVSSITSVAPISTPFGTPTVDTSESSAAMTASGPRTPVPATPSLKPARWDPAAHAGQFLEVWWSSLPRPDEPESPDLLDWWSQSTIHGADPDEVVEDWWTAAGFPAAPVEAAVEKWWNDDLG